MGTGEVGGGGATVDESHDATRVETKPGVGLAPAAAERRETN